MLLSTHAGVVQILAQHFPDTIILPVFGNADNEFHDDPSPSNSTEFFYNYMYDLWFRLLPGNVKHLSEDQLRDIRKTFLKGGHYRVDLTDKISYLALNTMYYDSEKDDHFKSGYFGYN